MPELSFAFEDGCFEVAGRPERIGAGFPERGLQPMLEAGAAKPKSPSADPNERFFEIADLSVGPHHVDLVLCFESGTLIRAWLGREDDRFWLVETHRRNVSVLRKLLPRRVKASPNRATAAFPRGAAQAVFRRNVGALTEPGASFFFEFEHPSRVSTDRPPATRRAAERRASPASRHKAAVRRVARPRKPK